MNSYHASAVPRDKETEKQTILLRALYLWMLLQTLSTTQITPHANHTRDVRHAIPLFVVTILKSRRRRGQRLCHRWERIVNKQDGTEDVQASSQTAPAVSPFSPATGKSKFENAHVEIPSRMNRVWDPQCKLIWSARITPRIGGITETVSNEICPGKIVSAVPSLAPPFIGFREKSGNVLIEETLYSIYPISSCLKAKVNESRIKTRAGNTHAGRFPSFFTRGYILKLNPRILSTDHASLFLLIKIWKHPCGYPPVTTGLYTTVNRWNVGRCWLHWRINVTHMRVLRKLM